MIQEKIAAVASRLQDAFPGSIVEDSYANDVYTFRVNLESATRWLQISRTALEEHENETLLALVDAHRVVEHFKRGATTLLLNSAGLHHVDPAPGKD